MRRLLAFLILAGIAVAGAVWLADRPGEVMIRWMGWRIDTSVPVLLAAIVAVMTALSLVWRLLRFVFGAPRRLLASHRTRRARLGYAALSDGLAAVASGDSRRAAKLARKADRLLKNNAVTGLLTAQAAQLSGDEDHLKAGWLAMTERPETAFLGHKGLMDLALKAGDRDTALTQGAQAFKINPGAEGLAARLFALQMEAGRLAEAELTLSQAKRASAMAGPELDRLRALVLFARAEEALAGGDSSHALTLALESRDRDPSFVPAIALAARLYGQRGKERKAQALILAAFKVAPHPLLTEAWAGLGGSEPPLERVKRMARLAEANPESPDGHFALAEAALAAHLWGQARSHLEKTLAQRPTRKVFERLAKLERDERRDEAAAQAWLARLPEAGPEPVWVCAACGAASPSYAVACPSCAKPGRLEWTA